MQKTSARGTGIAFFTPESAIKKPDLKQIGFLIGKSIEALILVFASGFRFFATLDAGALVILLLTEIGQNTGFCTTAFKTLQRAIQGFIFLHVNLRHFIPSLQTPSERKGHNFGLLAELL